MNDSYIDDRKLHEECGVFGAYDFDCGDIASTIYYGLFALQHRGQESCGIAVSDTEGPKGKVLSHKDMGLVNEVFNSENLEKLKGNIGVGHVRYSTAGSSTRENAQPLVLNYVKGTLGMAHNGNLLNAVELREELSYTGAIFQTTIDSEVIAYLIARERLNTPTVEEAVKNAMKKIKGAYSLIVMSPRKLIGARDPFGFKPLCIGKRDNTYFFMSVKLIFYSSIFLGSLTRFSRCAIRFLSFLFCSLRYSISLITGSGRCIWSRSSSTLTSPLITTLPGTPTTVELGGTFFSTTEPAPILQLSPIVTEPNTLAPAPTIMLLPSVG